MSVKRAPATLGEGVRKEAASTRKGLHRVTQILEAALQIIADERYESVTLERVAQRVGISKGNLQYYYPTKASLVLAAFAEQIERHREEWREAFERNAPSPLARLRRLIAFELAANRDPEFVAQVMERWAMSARDPAIGRLSEEWRRWVVGHYADLIGELRPELRPSGRRDTAKIVYGMVVGSAPHMSSDTTGSLDRRIEQAVLAVIEQTR